MGMDVAFMTGMRVSTSVESINRITSVIIECAIHVHRALGPGLLESAYLACLCFELTKAGVSIEVQTALPLVYQGVRVDCAYRADLIVQGIVIVEVKSQNSLAPIHVRQLLTYLRLAECPAGLLLNFGARTMKDGVKRVLNGFPV
jgi:GxxExxY protein